MVLLAVVVVLVTGAVVAAVAAVAERTSCSTSRYFGHTLTTTCSPRGGRGGGPGGAGGKKVIVEPHRHKGVFVARGGKEDLLATANLVPGESVYGEKRISVENPNKDEGGATTKTEYRVRPRRDPLRGYWRKQSNVVSHRSGTLCQSPRPNVEECRLTSCSRSKLAAGILGGLEQIYMKPGSKVLYLGAASGTSVSHVADIVGPTGAVFVGRSPKLQLEQRLISFATGCRVLPPLRQRSYQHGCKLPPPHSSRHFMSAGFESPCVLTPFPDPPNQRHPHR